MIEEDVSAGARRRRHLAAAAVLLAALASCSGRPPGDEAGAAPPASAPPARAEAPSRAPLGPVTEPGRLALSALPPAAAGVRLPRQPLPGPRHLVGLTGARVAALLGAPTFQRHDPPAEVWQYAIDACILDVFLYRHGDSLRVAHVEVRGPSVALVSGRDCFLGLVRARAGAGR